MSQALPGNHYCKDHQGNHSHYASHNCDLCKAQKDAARYRWLRDHACNSLHLTRNDEPACNYVTAKQWIEEFSSEAFEDCSPEEIQRMKDANTIWRLQIYPRTPVGFVVWNAATLDTVIDAAMSETELKSAP